MKAIRPLDAIVADLITLKAKRAIRTVIFATMLSVLVVSQETEGKDKKTYLT